MNEQNEIVLYQPNELTKLEVRVENESVWLNVNQMAELFGRDRTVITRHISNIFKEGEVDISLGCAKFAHMGTEGDQQYETTLYSLDVRAKGVVAAIYTNGVGSGMQRLIATHDAEKGKEHIEVHQWKNKSHDRWLIIDDTLYHCGHSLNAMGNHLSAISQMGISPEEILKQII